MIRKLLCAGSLLAACFAATPEPRPSDSYPEIAHVVSRHFCAELRSNVGPAIGMMMSNDRTIASATPMFSQYNALIGSGSAAHRNLTLNEMENLVGPLVKNVAAIEKLLNDPNAFPLQAATGEDARLLDIRDKLERVAASQEESLDVISGFVDSERLADLQHDSTEPVDAGAGGEQSIRPTADPATHDTDLPGLPPNPYYIDPADFPGLTLGANPNTRVAEGLRWTRSQAALQEQDAAKAVIDNLTVCKGR